jgi:hypothetical protein
MREALASWHMGRVIVAYRNHAFHGRPLRQEIVAGWVGITQAQLSRIENGPAIKDLDRLVQWARTLGVPAHLLWFKLPEQQPADPTVEDEFDQAAPRWSRPGLPEIDDMNRRELLRLMSMAGALLAVPHVEDQLDGERLNDVARRMGRLDTATVDQYAALNARLWSDFASSTSKAATFPSVRNQLSVLVGALRRSPGPTMRQRLCALAADLFQLAGEIFFDCNQYTEAAHCYTLAATASREANAFDLWACAMTRHAFICVYERQFDSAAPMLELAAGLAQRGDSSLSTRHWVNAVHAQALAGAGDLYACERALNEAERVQQLTGQVHNGGWLRFDGTRLAEERGACYVELRRPDLAEAVLTDALSQCLSTRRRGGVLTDLATVAVFRRDPIQLVMYGDAALDTARQTGSWVIARKLQRLQTHLCPFLADSHVRHLDTQISALTRTRALR